MNKQEFQQKIKDMKPPKFFNAITLGEAYKAGFEEAKGNALFESCFLDEPEKPVIPKYVADWYEENKGYFEYNLYNLCVDFHERKLQEDLHEWFIILSNKPIETLVKMKLYGYEVEKEKLYTVKFKLTGEYLHYDEEHELLCHYTASDYTASKYTGYHFIEDDLVKYHIWGNDNYEVKEVEQ